jgi:hypothetical protein
MIGVKPMSAQIGGYARAFSGLLIEVPSSE